MTTITEWSAAGVTQFAIRPTIFTGKRRIASLFNSSIRLSMVPLADAKPFDCSRTALRHPKETKGQDYDVTTEATARAAMAAVAVDFLHSDE